MGQLGALVWTCFLLYQLVYITDAGRFSDLAQGAFQTGVDAIKAGVAVVTQLHDSGQTVVATPPRVIPAAESDLELPLLGAQLSFAAYEKDEASLKCKLAGIDQRMQLLHFEPQPVRGHPQWFIADNSDAEQLFIVFRGTDSKQDIIRDLVVVPKGQRGQQFHGGFLHGVDQVKRCILDKLKELVSTRGTPKSVYVFGHSLGGALAMTFFAQRNLHDMTELRHVPLGVATFGAPKVFHESCSDCPPGRILAVVNEADVVPRLLGSPLPILRSLFSTWKLGASVIHPTDQSSVDDSVLLETLETYKNPDQTEFIYLEKGRAFTVHPEDTEKLLHLHQSFSLNLVADHSQYVAALESGREYAAGRRRSSPSSNRASG